MNYVDKHFCSRDVAMLRLYTPVNCKFIRMIQQRRLFLATNQSLNDV
ncbi:hypothetical protein [Fischerella sp.]|jgi:hypothetical protein|nr:hypothetical protein [Fischerella sp.]